VPPSSPLETARLTLEPWAPEDAQLLVRLSAMPEVMRFVGTGEVWSRKRAVASSDAVLVHWARHGFGWRRAVERDGGSAVGFIALNVLGEGMAGLADDEYEIGWWLDPAFSGRGFAVEGALAVRDDALARLGAGTVVARIQPANAASIRVAERIGLVFEVETRGVYGEPVAVYRGPPAR
jgi:RimJ/RimL family protein N-acetyltransferase